jgi:uncharacterized PurR-regulated membrane protein YhhQ (DUF165 family)
MKMVMVILYLLAILLANVITASNDPILWGKLIIPAGSFLIGATFILRDLVQNTVGRRNTYLAIGAALLLSAVMSYIMGDSLWIVVASAAAFLVSETTDTEIYTRLRLPMSLRVLYSGVVGGLLDSMIFVLIAFSPIGAGILPWEVVGYAVAGQIVVKVAMQCAGALIVQFMPKPKRIVNG